MRYKIPIRVFSTIMLIICSGLTLADKTPHSQLHQIEHKISLIQSLLVRQHDKLTRYQQELQKTEISSGKLLIQLTRTQQNLRRQHTHLNKLHAKTNDYQAQLDEQRTVLAQQIRASYQLTRQPYLKLLLNQSNLQQMSRILSYYRYIEHAQVVAMQRLQTTLHALRTNEQQVTTQTRMLQQLVLQQQHQHTQLERARHTRQILIHQINSQIKTKKQRLMRLRTNKQVLEKTIARIAHQARVHLLMQQDFARLQGKLPWPTLGKITTRFGTPIYHSELHWDGILINATENQPVHAIATGKVVFAKWLPGYGLLLIISHGHGYMTLYGRNHYLYKKPGDIVQPGDLLAAVGNSGGYARPALYFAIRHNAKPLNPVNWCQSTSRSNG